MTTLEIKYPDDFEVRLNDYLDQFNTDKNINPSELNFDIDKGELLFKGKSIVVSKSKNTDPYYLLSIIFREKGKIWNYDEIWEDPYFHSKSKVYSPKIDWQKIYHAAYGVNKKIAMETTITDFLNISKTTLSINKKYLT